jgi:type IV pilus assembly protein PilW
MNNKIRNNLQNKNRGFSLVELMIAILIGLIILTGLVTVFDTSQRMSRTQNGLARIQENGRYVLSLMKGQVAQAGYSSCFGEKEESPILGGPINPLLPPPPAALATTKVAWDVKTANFIPGVPTETIAGRIAFDPGYLLFGHECDAGGTCIPALTDPGADISANVPAVGTGDGDRIAGTDVLTVRYLRGGREVDSVDPSTNSIILTAFANANPPDTVPTSGQVLLMSCDADIKSPTVMDIVTIGAGVITTLQTPPDMSVIPTIYNLERDLVNVTYYVANKIVGGRSIPTLYSSFNGVTNAVIEGVDAFDVVYGVKDGFSNTMYINAGEVQNNLTPLNCWPAPQLLGGIGAAGTMTNVAGCGWRSVATVEIHLLLNTLYNSSTQDVSFKYSQYGSGESTTADIPSAIPHYKMHRKEFTATIALKNIIH